MYAGVIGLGPILSHSFSAFVVLPRSHLLHCLKLKIMASQSCRPPRSFFLFIYNLNLFHVALLNLSFHLRYVLSNINLLSAMKSDCAEM